MVYVLWCGVCAVLWCMCCNVCAVLCYGVCSVYGVVYGRSLVCMFSDSAALQVWPEAMAA